MKKFKKHILTKTWELYTCTTKESFNEFVREHQKEILLIF